MPALKAVAFEQLGVPRRWPGGDIVGAHSLTGISKRPSDDLFDLAFVQVYAWPEHSAKLRFGAAKFKIQLHTGLALAKTWLCGWNGSVVADCF